MLSRLTEEKTQSIFNIILLPLFIVLIMALSGVAMLNTIWQTLILYYAALLLTLLHLPTFIQCLWPDSSVIDSRKYAKLICLSTAAILTLLVSYALFLPQKFAYLYLFIVYIVSCLKDFFISDKNKPWLSRLRLKASAVSLVLLLTLWLVIRRNA